MKKTFSILFDSYHLYHLPQFEPLINLLSKDDRFEIFHSTSRTLGIEEFKLCCFKKTTWNVYSSRD